jgi:prevent-host-death family protein
MTVPATGNGTKAISAMRARAQFGKLLDYVARERQSVVIEKRGMPRAVLMNLQDYIRLSASEPKILRISGQESRRKGTDKLGELQIERIIGTVRADKKRRKR